MVVRGAMTSSTDGCRGARCLKPGNERFGSAMLKNAEMESMRGIVPSSGETPSTCSSTGSRGLRMPAVAWWKANSLALALPLLVPFGRRALLTT
ncbi:MAG: hypothetical protein WCL44_10650 [bacterium]